MATVRTASTMTGGPKRWPNWCRSTVMPGARAWSIAASHAASGLKFFNVYGPNEYHKGSMRSVLVQLHAQARSTGVLRLFKSHQAGYPDGGQLRDFVYVRDCAQAIQWLLDHPKVSGLFNLGSGTARSFLDVAHALMATMPRRKLSIEFFDMPETLKASYQSKTEAAMQRLRAAGYTQAFTSLEDGVKDYVKNYLEKPDPYL